MKSYTVIFAAEENLETMTIRAWDLDHAYEMVDAMGLIIDQIFPTDMVVA